MEETVRGLQQETRRRDKRLTKENKEQAEGLNVAKMKRSLLVKNVPHRQSTMELLTPRDLSQTTEVHISTRSERKTIPDPSDTLGD